MDFHSHFLDKSAQNAASSSEHMKNYIQWMYDIKFFIKDAIIYDTTYGCSKQYRSANSMSLFFVLVFTYRVIIYGGINAPGQGRSKIDGIHAFDKYILKTNKLHDSH